jgi:hypothetical protein
VNAAKRGKKIVLATPIWLAEQQRYRRDFDPYQAYGLCTQDAEGKLSFRQPVSTELQQQIEAYRNNISCGYISLPDDPLVVPSQIPMLDNSFLDSFSLAVARAGWPTLVENIGSRVFYGSYISEEKLRNSNVILSAKLVRQSSNEQALAEIRSLVEAKAVIVG